MSYDPSFKYHPTIKKNTFLCQKYCNDQFRVWRENGSWKKIPISNQTFLIVEKWTHFPSCRMRILRHNMYLDQKYTEIVGEDFAHMDKKKESNV
jgi:hypothetical protein